MNYLQFQLLSFKILEIYIGIANAKVIWKANLEVQVSCCILSSKGAVVVDGNAIIWCLIWPKDGILSHLAEAMYEYIEKKLLYSE